MSAAPTIRDVDSTWDDAERAGLVALLRARPNDMTWRQITADVGCRASALSLWHELQPPALFSDAAIAKELTAAAADIARWRASDHGFLTFQDDEYPEQIREIHEIPAVLFYRGTLVPDDIGVCVVGSRTASSRGLDIAEQVATGLVQRGITVVSGLAKGVDAAAHRAALTCGGRTVAVIGTGISRFYPAEHRELQEQIAHSGLVLSQFWPDAAPTKQSFPMRNAVMSGYGRATVVVEAGERSGARIQARQAVEHGRAVILTDAVVQANSWAADLVERPGVHVASSPAEILALVDDVVAGRQEIGELLAMSEGPEH